MLNFKKQKLLIIAPHPDDEVLGCSGLIRRVKKGGGRVFVLFMTVGDTKDYSAKGKSTGNQRIKEIGQVAKFLNYDDYKIALKGNKYHLKLDQVPQLTLISIIENYIEELKPTIVVTTEGHDYNQDHRACYHATIAATRPAPLTDRYIPNAIFGYRSVVTADWADAHSLDQTLYLPLSKQAVATKKKAMGLYSSQVRTKGHQRTPDAIEIITRNLGIHAGVEYAESYHIFRLIA